MPGQAGPPPGGRSGRRYGGRYGDRFRYGAWREGPDPLAPPFDVRGAVDRIGRDVLGGSSLRQALDNLLRRGHGPTKGLDALRELSRMRREELRRRGNLGGAVDQARAALDQALALERDTLAFEDGDQARFDEMRLADLPESVAAAVRDLADYDWHSAKAREMYQQITEKLRGDILDHQFEGLKDALADPDPAAMQAFKDMLTDLNDLLAAHAREEDVEEQFRDFMDKHGDFFPENPQNVDELVDQLARQQAAAERMLRSLSPEQRAELEGLMQQALAQAGLDEAMAQLSDNLSTLRPGMMRGRAADIDGDQPLGYGEAAGVLGELAEVESLEAQLGQRYAGSSLDDVDVEAVERQLGGAAAADLRALRELEAELARQGYTSRDGDRLSLTPKALRRLGESTLARIFADLDAGRAGDHEEHRAGSADERTGAFLPWTFGSEQPIDAVRTVTNAIQRSAERARPGFPALTSPAHGRHRGGGAEDPSSLLVDDVHGRVVPLRAEDFVVAEVERRTQAAVALCVDLSFSMVNQGRWGPMKQTALALSHLVQTRFRQDALQIIGFNIVARKLTPLQLAEIEPEWVQGTNLEHALLLATQHLRRHPDAEPIVLVVTDGEPTAHLDRDGEPIFWWPTSQATVRATVAQVDALTRYGATLNIFRLGDDPGLERFLDALARRAGGRVFAPDLDRLGQYVVADYLRARRGRRRTA